MLHLKTWTLKEVEEEKENKKLIRKPSKLNITADQLAAKQEAARSKKLEMERAKRHAEDRLRIEAERENYVSEDEDQERVEVAKFEFFKLFEIFV